MGEASQVGLLVSDALVILLVGVLLGVAFFFLGRFYPPAKR